MDQTDYGKHEFDDQARPGQARQDQARQDQARPDQARQVSYPVGRKDTLLPLFITTRKTRNNYRHTVRCKCGASLFLIVLMLLNIALPYY